ncbi:P-loop NTPase family protein [Lentzea nigeriaca]|uniref:FtsK/SpoIIIE domain-containing protein n=1 Tax=Lentzea nigeriaca TaxID=1128665 RepID=UPI001957D48D|nr:FtsK/SpoIIIE domain-containing protein [Lentzea nigeriaca]MBM7861902.1 S-DNA-T family DNA segregation ATPase FtsK/SpoIIIE [Lentzea nigeriaca]
MTVTTLTGASDPHDRDEFEHTATVTPLHPATSAEVTETATVIEGELVDDDAPGDEGDVTGSVVLVDQPGGDSVHWVRRLREAKREPIIPAYLRSWEEARATARWVAGHYAHATGYHAVRSPLYLLRLAVRSPRGALLLAAATGRWASDAEGRQLRAAAARDEDTRAYLQLSAQRNTRVTTRTLTLVITAAIGVPALMLLPDVVPSWVMWACGTLAVALLGRLGTPADQPVVSRAVVATHVAKLTADAVEQALSVLGISLITQALAKNPQAINFVAPIHRDGPGWRAEVDLPRGVTASDVIEKREKLASGLGRPLGCVWPEGKPEIHPGRLVLWVGDKDMSKASQPAWPLRTGKRIDLFEPQPFGTDVRGKWVDVVLMYVAGIVGAIPRMGKTFTLRELLLIAALDPRSAVYAFDLKGTGDLSPLEVVAHRYRAGDDPEDIEYMLACLRELRDEMRRRTKVIRELPPDICPENKVTSPLASKKSLGLHPVVVGVDECQVMFEHPEHGAEFEEIVTDLVKRGPATGIVVILATQRPDSKSIPMAISDNAILRFCLKVTGQIANDMVLGTSSYKNGERATQFSFGDKGIGLLKGVGDETQTVKGVYIDAPGAKALAARARAMRVDAGTLSGYAAGVDAEVDDIEAANTLLQDLLNVFGTADKRWSESLVDALAELRPNVYGEWAALPTGAAKATTLSTALKPFGITTKQVWSTENGKGANRMGVERAAVAAALTERDGKKRRG